MKTPLIWEKVTHSGKHHAILFIDSVFQGYREGVIGKFFQIDFNPTHYRQFAGARWWLQDEVQRYITALREKENKIPGILLRKAREYKRWNKGLLRWSRLQRRTDFRELSNGELLQAFTGFFGRLAKINALVYTPIFLDRFYTDEVVQCVAKREQDFRKQQEYLTRLLSVDWGLESHYERESLVRIAERIQRNGLTASVSKDIRRHVERFAHLSLVAFHGRLKDKKDVLRGIRDMNVDKETKNIKSLKQNAKMVRAMIQRLDLTKDEICKIETIRRWTQIANDDDHYVMGSIHALRILWHEIARRFGVSYNQFTDMRIDEVKDGLHKGGVPNALKKELEARQRANALVWDKQGTRLLTGKRLSEYAQLEKEQEGIWLMKEIRGIPASPGKARGRAQLITDVRDVHKVKKGSILIAVYTYPAIVVAMEKASAIVTDQGGLLSHAAIVSRELGKPCILGTRIATQVLRDGDMVEVNANKGIVKVIAHAKK